MVIPAEPVTALTDEHRTSLSLALNAADATPILTSVPAAALRLRELVFNFVPEQLFLRTSTVPVSGTLTSPQIATMVRGTLTRTINCPPGSVAPGPHDIGTSNTTGFGGGAVTLKLSVPENMVPF